MAGLTVDDRLLGRATLASIGVHVLAALFIPALVWTASSQLPVETISFAHVTRIRIETRLQPRPQPRAQAQVASPVPVVSFATRVELTHTTPRHAPAPPSIARPRSAAPAVAAVAQTGATKGQGSAPPQASASPLARTVASAATTHADGGYLPFGAEQPDPVLDPAVRKELASLDVHVTLVVTVDSNGHFKSVVFQPPLDPQLQARIESLLADANWDPAVCGGGIACEGQTTIKL